MRVVDDASGDGLARVTSHVIGCHMAQETRVQNALVDAASDVFQAYTCRQ
jgi:hypothetical protein